MKAIVCTTYGPPDVLEFKEVEKPAPKPNEILIKVHASTVTTGDIRIRKFESPPLYWLPMRIMLGFSKPRQPILGVELAGEVESVGTAVTRFKAGDFIYALSGMRFGAHAEYACLPEDGIIAHKPENASFEEAAALPFGGTTALHYFRKGKMKSGQKVLIYGASGAVGTAAVQLAKGYGGEVTGVCSAANFELVKSLGADKMLDYTKEDFIRNKERYDLVFDAVGKMSNDYAKKVLSPSGSYVSVRQGMAKIFKEDLLVLKELMEQGKIKPVIDRRYPLQQAAEAHRYVEKGRKRGNVVITIGSSLK
ncbi:NAD(P)-dependent alcohol dehydrogenase [Paenibacillus sp. GCM10027627]|uniref:NAD(P)-dependent alcohol dehydrogenase n=1 Tax=unclassified Paenibacillus TaxID=185978 RepID=UPI00363F5FC0